MISINLDVSELQGLLNITGNLESVAAGMSSKMAQVIKDKAIDLANSKLHSRRKMYVDGLSIKEGTDGVWLVSLNARVRFIDDGKSEWNMLEDLLKSPKAKVAKDGCVLNPRNKILTSTGYKKIKDIIPGDLVLTHSGKFREVKEVLKQKAGVGTEYVSIFPYSADFSKGRPSKENSGLTLPSFSLTLDHLVLTKSGWIKARDLKKGDLVATPADLDRLCKECNSPLPINTPNTVYCVSGANRCATKAACKEGRVLNISKEDRKINGILANRRAKESGVFERSDWGARNPEHLHKMRIASNAAMRNRISDGKWEPEELMAKFLTEVGLEFEREFPIKTDRIVNAGHGRTKRSTLFCDFYLKSINTVIELDGTYWHSNFDAQERDLAKDKALERDGIKIVRIPSHTVYGKGKELAESLALLAKNHSGKLGIAWVKIGKIKRGIVNRPDHIFSNKYDLCLDAEEHSFCCETVFIHNSKYLIVPFDHSPNTNGPASTTPAQQDIMSEIKGELKKRNIPFSKFEKDASGNDKMGRLHSFDITKGPLKMVDGPGMGHGPIGDVRQGPTGIPFLQNVSIYQGKDANGKTKRSIMTFRVASSKHKDQGRWDHPSVAPTPILEEATDWAMKEFEKEVAPAIMSKILDF